MVKVAHQKTTGEKTDSLANFQSRKFSDLNRIDYLYTYDVPILTFNLSILFINTTTVDLVECSLCMLKVEVQTPDGLTKT